MCGLLRSVPCCHAAQVNWYEMRTNSVVLGPGRSTEVILALQSRSYGILRLRPRCFCLRVAGLWAHGNRTMPASRVELTRFAARSVHSLSPSCPHIIPARHLARSAVLLPSLFDLGNRESTDLSGTMCHRRTLERYPPVPYAWAYGCEHRDGHRLCAW